MLLVVIVHFRNQPTQFKKGTEAMIENVKTAMDIARKSFRGSGANCNRPRFTAFYEIKAARPSGSECRIYDGHERKVDDTTPTQASWLRPWIRCFTKLSLFGGIQQ